MSQVTDPFDIATRHNAVPGVIDLEEDTGAWYRPLPQPSADDLTAEQRRQIRNAVMAVVKSGGDMRGGAVARVCKYILERFHAPHCRAAAIAMLADLAVHLDSKEG